MYIQYSGAKHRDITLEQQQTEKTETLVRDVDRIRITEVYASCPEPVFVDLLRSPGIDSQPG
jgi:hypothetical protein